MPIVACENIRFSSLFAAGDVESEEKRMFSQAMPIGTVNHQHAEIKSKLEAETQMSMPYYSPAPSELFRDNL